jgi:hypothetical protein
MKRKESETEKFNAVMDQLLSVPHSELKKKLDEEKKAKKKKPAKTSSSVRVSDKKRS